MPVHRCGISTVCLHELRGLKPDEAEVLEYVEVDPTGRYGRYEEVLGKGAFKTVYRAFDQEDGIEVAWNQVEDVLLRTQEDLDRLYSEIDLLSQLKHKNIIKLYHSWVDKKAHTVNFITEIFTSGTLRQYRRKHKHIDIKAVKNWSRQILRGLLYLHSHDPPIIHRDLKCDNIFINGNQGEVKIGDLGLAAILQHTHARSVIGTPEFMAPELYEEEYDELVDIYSFGMCLLEMATAEYPYSECSNAAQIYKKVLTGKKPEALESVKDPELRHFIEKCLAPASKRLPARELLADPFLDSEGSHSSLEHASLTDRTAQNAIRGKELKLINDDAHTMDTAMRIEYVLEEKLPGMEPPKSSAGSPHIVQNGDWNALQAAAPIPSFSMEDWERYVDFKVDGKGRENDTVFLKFRISGSEGRVRDIHFPFDIESDTAMCVACEMVAELDLTDQDVTKIAEMIDAAIIVLVPEWKPGVAIDEACCEVPDCDIEFVDILDGGSSDGFLKNVLPDASTPEIMSPSGIEGLIDGQVEELRCQFCRSEFLPEVEPCIEQCSVSSDTTDSSKDAGWTLSDISSSNTSQLDISAEQAIAPHFEYAVLDDSIEAKDNRHSPTYFNERFEFEGKNGCTNYAYKLWEGFAHEIRDSCHDSILASEYVKEEYDEEADRELAELFIQYEREKQELQRKYKDAVDKVRTRQQQRRNIKSENSDDRYHNACRMLLERPLERLQIEEHLLEAQRNWSCEYPSANGSMTSFEEFSSVDQETPRCTYKSIEI